MELEVLPTPEEAAVRAAELVAGGLRDALAQRPRASLALSGGTTPGAMLRRLGTQELDWTRVHVFQVDERVVAANDAARNLASLVRAVPPHVRQSAHLHPMPVEAADLDGAAARYARQLHAIAGTPPVLDVVHLGLGADGHTASLVPGDAALDATTDVAVSGVYHGLRRMTLTFQVINGARHRVFLVTGASKGAALGLLEHGDPSIVASRVTGDHTVVIVSRDVIDRGTGAR